MITVEQAESLAIVYHQLNVANDRDDTFDKARWAAQLLELQQATGVKLQPEWVLKHVISFADWSSSVALRGYITRAIALKLESILS